MSIFLNMNNKYYTVCGIVEIEGKIVLVRHTYGNAKDRILLPGGFVQENELPTTAIEREIFEETNITAKAKSIIAVQFKPEQWCAVFLMEYIREYLNQTGSKIVRCCYFLPKRL